ncbi:MAG TPA: hypothetical protein DCF33_14265 [Saprospirales bacterium]|nr:hypothetical protein [Saprospirales bacterium]
MPGCYGDRKTGRGESSRFSDSLGHTGIVCQGGDCGGKCTFGGNEWLVLVGIFVITMLKFYVNLQLKIKIA